jgi:hypothetical protein
LLRFLRGSVPGTLIRLFISTLIRVFLRVPLLTQPNPVRWKGHAQLGPLNPTRNRWDKRQSTRDSLYYGYFGPSGTLSQLAPSQPISPSSCATSLVVYEISCSSELSPCSRLVQHAWVAFLSFKDHRFGLVNASVRCGSGAGNFASKKLIHLRHRHKQTVGHMLKTSPRPNVNGLANGSLNGNHTRYTKLDKKQDARRNVHIRFFSAKRNWTEQSRGFLVRPLPGTPHVPH